MVATRNLYSAYVWWP